MPSKLDDTELDARWRAGLEAAAEPGRWVEVETRVAGHVSARRRHRRSTAIVAVAATVVAAIAAVLVTTRDTGTKVRTADSAPRIALVHEDGTFAPSATFDPQGVPAQTVYGPRFSLGIQSSIPGDWRVRVDENPAVTVAVTNVDPEENAASASTMVEADPGTYSVTITGTRRGAAEPDPAIHGTLTVLSEPAGPPVATVMVESWPTLTLTVTPDVVPAGVIQLDYATRGGTHAIVIDGVPGVQLMGPSGPSSRKVELAPGTYRLHDTIPGHDGAGEHATLTVVAP